MIRLPCFGPTLLVRITFMCVKTPYEFPGPLCIFILCNSRYLISAPKSHQCSAMTMYRKSCDQKKKNKNKRRHSLSPIDAYKALG